MKSFLPLLTAVVLSGCSGDQAETSAFRWPERLADKSVLFVGAHPDDEWGVSPLLAQACVDERARCHFVVTSDANSIGCLLSQPPADPQECSRVRRGEMQRSARLFDAEAEFYGWSDLFYAFNNSGLKRTIDEWAKEVGGRRALVARLERTLRERRPQIVFTLDPRHGSTCHPAHRATALLLIEAIGRLPESERPQVWLEQTDNIDERSSAVASTNKHFGYAGWPETASQTVWFDANQKLKNGRPAYDQVEAVLRAHPSQFPKVKSGEERVDAPPNQRRVPLVPLGAYAPADYCTQLKLDRPTLDIPGNKERLGIK